MIKFGSQPIFSPFVRLYFKIRAREFFCRVWVIGFVTNALAVSMGYSYVQSSAELKMTAAQMYAELHYGMGLIWVNLIAINLTSKLYRSPIQVCANKTVFSALPLNRRDSVYCGLIDSMVEGRSFIMFFLFFIAAYFLSFHGTATSFLLFALPFLVGTELITTALAAFLHRRDQRIRAALIKVGILYLALTFASIAWDFPSLGRLLATGIVDPIGIFLGSIILGEHTYLLIPWNLCLYGLTAWSLNYILYRTPTPGLGWADDLPEPLKIYHFDAQAHADRVEQIARSSKKEIIASAFVVFLIPEAFWINSQLKTMSFSLSSPLVICAILFCHFVVAFSWTSFSLQRPLPISTSKILFETFKLPAVFMILAGLIRAGLYFALGFLNDKDMSVVAPHALLLVMWAVPFACYCAAVCLTAGLFWEWLSQRGALAWRFISVMIAAAIGFLFWLGNYHVFAYFFEKPLIGITLAAAISVTLFRASIFLFERLEFSSSDRRFEPNIIEDFLARRA